MGKSPLNFSISRLLSAGAAVEASESKSKTSRPPTNNNNNVTSNRNHKHTIHYRASSPAPEKHVTTRHDDVSSDSCDETEDSSRRQRNGDRSDSDIEMDDPDEDGKGGGSPQSNRSTPESDGRYGHHHPSQLASSSSPSYPGNMEGLGVMNPFPMLGYSSIFLPNFPCPITSSPNHVIRVPAHRPMSNFGLFGQSGLAPHNPLDMNSAPLFSTFDPRSSLLLKDRLNGEWNFKMF